MNSSGTPGSRFAMTRETFRHVSYVGMGAVDEVKGLGAQGYVVALEKAANL